MPVSPPLLTTGAWPFEKVKTLYLPEVRFVLFLKLLTTLPRPFSEWIEFKYFAFSMITLSIIHVVCL